MSKKAKIKVKVKRRKLKIKNIVVSFIILLIIIFSGLLIIDIPLKNIYITGNNILTDKEIITLANLSDYPSFISISINDIKKDLTSNSYIIQKYILK